MPSRNRAVEFLGLNGDPHEDGRVPKWDGSPPGTAWRYVSIWAAIAVGGYLLLNSRMPDQDGFGGFIPGFFAIVVGMLGVSVTERSRLRTHDRQ